MTLRQTSVHTSSSSSSSSSSGFNVGVGGGGSQKRGREELVGVAEDPPPAPTPTPPPNKDRKDSEITDEDWEWDGEESSTEAGGGDVLPPTPRPPSQRTSGSQARIYKTSLRDYVGLEGMAFHMSTGLHTAHEAVDVVHQKLRKTVSDISSSLRHSSSQELPRRATMDEIPRRGPLEDAPKRPLTDDTKKHPATSPSEDHLQQQLHRRNLLEEVHRKSTSAEDATVRKFNTEEIGKKTTTEETARRTALEDRLTQKDRQRPPTTATTVQGLSRAQALYKSDSKSSLSETELKVEVRTSTGVTKTDQGSMSSSMACGTRKVSPLMGHRSSLSQRSGLASGTDSSMDSDHSYEYSHSQTLTPVPAASTLVPTSIRGRSEVSVVGASRPISVSRDPSLDNITSSVTSSDSSSQELDSAHVTEDSHSSEAADETDAAHHHSRAMTYSSSGCGGSSGGESGYVSPYLSTERGGLVTLGPSLLLTRATIAQYDTKRTITTVVAPKSSFDENRVRIQVPAAAAAGGVAPSRGIMASTAGGSIGAEVSVTRTGQSQGGVLERSERSVTTDKTVPTYSLRTNDQELSSSPRTRLEPEPRSPVPSHVSSPEHPRKPSPNRNPRFV
ncbi:serine-rich adhesin for platelets-like [Palaemon carinicauda]|uniref:serine-rich adhesin for platelets-like n=1 Tax=Palaemon carinicauda TaxID=392227 RepID=UPI0035B574E9